MKKLWRVIRALGVLLVLLNGEAIGWGAPTGCRPSGEPLRSTPGLGQRAYVWQRVWTDVLQRDLRQHAAAFEALDVLAAEIDFRGEEPAVTCPAVNWTLLKELGTPAALVVRIGPRKSTWRKCPGEIEYVTTVCRRVLQSARAAGIAPIELQIDYDAATAQLRDYRALLAPLRRAMAEVPLVITALPTWLDSADFPELIAATDGYVLQLHSLKKPDAPGELVTLFDLERARVWITRAGGLHRPFRVALPTYGYRVGYGRDGRFLGLQAEGAARAWPAGATVSSVWAEPAPVARLVGELLRQRGTACEAISWFRFPCAGDELSWRWATLSTVMRGEVPRAEWTFQSLPQAAGAVDIGATNTGTDRGSLRAVGVKWDGGGLIAADGIGGWRAERVGASEVVFRPRVEGENEVLPGESIAVGWLRLPDPETRLTISPQ